MYLLDKSSAKYICPKCGKRTFVLYLSNEGTGTPLSDKVGRCDREQKCGYHYTPKSYFHDNGITPPKGDFHKQKYVPRPSEGEPSTLPFELVSRWQGNDSDLCVFLRTIFDAATVDSLVEKYHLGVTTMQPPMFAEPKHTLLWRIDEKQRPRCAKIMKFNTATGHRLKSDNGDKPKWLHSLLQNTEYCPTGWDADFRQCFFGQHLIHDNVTLGLVEGEKTALVASVFFPDLVWISCGGLSNLKKVLENEWQVLQGHKLLIYADAGCVDKWKEYFKPYEDVLNHNFTFSLFLEDHCDEAERAKGIDIADWLISYQKEKCEAKEAQVKETKQPNKLKAVSDEPYYMRFKQYPALSVTRNDNRYNTLIDFRDPRQCFAKIDWLYGFPSWTIEEWIAHYKRIVRSDDIPHCEENFYNHLELFEYTDRDRGLIHFIGKPQ